MINIKPVKVYYFSVEGHTEKWYLEWLQTKINECQDSVYRVSFDCKIEKNPLKRVKTLTIVGKTHIYHFADYESDDEEHVKNFTEIMNNMKKVSELGKQVKYIFGYSNLTFDLWIILHKANCSAPYVHRTKYIETINSVYHEHFFNMDDYKREDNFKRILRGLSLNDVKTAVLRANNIQKNNRDNGYILHKYKGYSYYKENPSLSLGDIIGNILNECGI